MPRKRERRRLSPKMSDVAGANLGLRELCREVGRLSASILVTFRGRRLVAEEALKGSSVGGLT
jgi:hypothetical protein